MSWKKTSANNSILNLPTKQQILKELEQQQQQIKEIQQQHSLAMKLQQSFNKKQQEIVYLNTLIQRYKPYYQKYSVLKLQLIEKESTIKGISKQNALLKRQFDNLLKDCQQFNIKNKTMQHQKQILIRQRHSFQRVNRQIQQIFKEYQLQCRMREQQLLQALQISSLQIKNLKNKIQEQSKQIPSKGQLQQLKKIQEYSSQKDKQIQKLRFLNSQLSIEYDKSVVKICQFQKQLNHYRMENHQLKKTLGLVIEQDKYQRLHEKYLIENKKDNRIGKSQEEENSSQEEDDSSIVMGQSSPQLSQARY